MMHDVEKVIFSIVENLEMRMHFISILDNMKAVDIAELIMTAKVSVEKKRELLKMLEETDDAYQWYVDYTESILREFYSGLEVDVTVLGYNTGNYSKSAVKTEGFKSAISAKRYIKENYGSDWAEKMWFEVKIKKENGEEKSFILNSEGDLWSSWDKKNYVPRMFNTLVNRTELTVPFKVGDIISIDMRPFKESVKGVIMEKESNCVRYMYVIGMGYVGMQTLKTLALPALRSVNPAELSEDEDVLAFASTVIDENGYGAAELTEFIVAQNGAHYDQLVELIGNKAFEVTEEWKERVKWLKPDRFDFYSFINSKNIREHVKKIGYEMSGIECMYVVESSNRTLKEKNEAYCEIIKNMPDVKIPHKTEYLHEFLKKRMELEKILMDVFYQRDNAVYVYEIVDEGEREASDEVFSELSDCMNNALYRSETADLVRIEKRWIMNTAKDSLKKISVIFNRKKEPVHISERGILADGLREKLWSIIYLNDIRLPLPFKKGDILHTLTDGVFVYEPDWDKSCMGGYLNDGFHRIGLYTILNWIDAEYYKKPLKGEDKNLEAVSLYLKGDLSLVKFIEKCRKM